MMKKGLSLLILLSCFHSPLLAMEFLSLSSSEKKEDFLNILTEKQENGDKIFQNIEFKAYQDWHRQDGTYLRFKLDFKAFTDSIFSSTMPITPSFTSENMIDAAIVALARSKKLEYPIGSHITCPNTSAFMKEFFYSKVAADSSFREATEKFFLEQYNSVSALDKWEGNVMKEVQEKEVFQKYQVGIPQVGILTLTLKSIKERRKELNSLYITSISCNPSKKRKRKESKAQEFKTPSIQKEGFKLFPTSDHTQWQLTPMTLKDFKEKIHDFVGINVRQVKEDIAALKRNQFIQKTNNYS